MLQRNLLYTGVTRGKRLVALVGQKKAVATAVRNVLGRRRWSKLSVAASQAASLARIRRRELSQRNYARPAIRQWARKRPNRARMLSRKDWHSTVIGAVVSSLGCQGCPEVAPRRLDGRCGASVVRRNAAINRTEDLHV